MIDWTVVLIAIIVGFSTFFLTRFWQISKHFFDIKIEAIRNTEALFQIQTRNFHTILHMIDLKYFEVKIIPFSEEPFTENTLIPFHKPRKDISLENEFISYSKMENVNYDNTLAIMYSSDQTTEIMKKRFEKITQLHTYISLICHTDMPVNDLICYQKRNTRLLGELSQLEWNVLDSIGDSISLISQFKKNKMLLWHI